MAHKKAGRKARGRPVEPLKLEGNWKDAVKKALGRGKPPSPPKKKKGT
jgi:hypothetical protein